MKIQSTSVYAAYSYMNISPHQKQAPADVTANFSASGATISDTVAISQAARNYLDDQSNSATASGNSATAIFDTDQGSMNLNIGAYFSPNGSANGAASSFQTLPPLLIPSKNNIDTLTNHISATFHSSWPRTAFPPLRRASPTTTRGKFNCPQITLTLRNSNRRLRTTQRCQKN